MPILSVYTAKELYGLKIHEAPDPEQAAAAKREVYEKKLQGIKASYQAKGQQLNEQYAVTEGGQVLTEERKLTKEEIDKAVRRVSRIVKIGMFMNRYPAELSGGQQQRVAIARTWLRNQTFYLWMNHCLTWMPNYVWKCGMSFSVSM